MITWTTYGNWLQGDKRGYVKDGKILRENDALLKSNLKRLKNPATRLDTEHCIIVRRAVLKKAKEIRQQIYAIAVCSNHVHIVAERTNESIEKVVSFYKNAARLVLIKKSWEKRLNMLKTITTQMVSPQVYPEGHHVLRFTLRVIMSVVWSLL